MQVVRVILPLLLFVWRLDVVGQISAASKDTLNITDSLGRKQGHWIIYGPSKRDSCYTSNDIVEEGNYENSKKQGVWTEYYCNKQIRSSITYKNGRPHGAAKLYYDNGASHEEGTWINNRWVGKYKCYERDGTVIEFDFDEKGKRIHPPKEPPLDDKIKKELEKRPVWEK